MALREFAFSKFSPSGNTTIFLHLGERLQAWERAFFCGEVLKNEVLAAEQAGLADIYTRHVEMAAGEFCVNACRAFGALLDMQAEDNHAQTRFFEMTISGLGEVVQLEVSGNMPLWQVKAGFELDSNELHGDLSGSMLVRLPGISHLLVRADKFPDNAREAAAALRQEHDLDNLPACGVVWWRPTETGYRIWPFVSVPDAGTALLENSCGSATIALALALASSGAGSCQAVQQPCGEILDVKISGRRVWLGGSVRLVALGKVWLNTPTR